LSTLLEYFNTIFSNYAFVHAIPVTQRAGGIGLLVHKNLSYNLIDSTNNYNSSHFGNLAEHITVDIIRSSVKFRFYLFYRHPSTSMSDFVDSLVCYLRIHKPLSRSLIIGDINIDLMKFDPAGNSCVDRYLNELNNLNFIPYSILPTHCNGGSPSLIDHVFATFGNADTDSNYIA
jgi:hypothetical protein